ncbi:MAG TPA: type II secretion system protein GspE, partial [Myxococcota bacterium]|nr:type II secretion system protein GspE [Myxococcota bacterium]
MTSAAPGAAVGAGSLELGEILLRETRLSPEQLEAARVRQAESQERLADVLVEEGFLNADEVLHALGQQLGLPVVASIDSDAVDEGLLVRVPIGFAKQHRLLPLGWASEGVLQVAVGDPLDVAPLDDLHLLFDGAEIELVLAREPVILNAINLAYDRGVTSTDQLATEASDDLDALATEISHEPQDLLESTDDAPIIRLVNSLLQRAVKERASDIHIEPFE